MADKKDLQATLATIQLAYAGLRKAVKGEEPQKLVDETGKLFQGDIFCPFCLNANTMDENDDRPVMSFAFGTHMLHCPTCDQEWGVEEVAWATLDLVLDQLTVLEGIAVILPAMRPIKADAE